MLGAELRACGVDLSFTPVLDLDHGASSVIGDRAFHRDPRVVTLLAKSLMHGLLLAGMANCGKHFPGHGYRQGRQPRGGAGGQAHLKAILADDARPYEWLSTSLASVMPAHVIYPKVDPGPAGFSPRWLKDILRGQLGFTGAVFSDDLSMEGARRLDGGDLTLRRSGSRWRSTRAATWCCCATRAPTAAKPSTNCWTDFSCRPHAGHWQADPDSEARRLALLPQTPPLTWDELMHQPAYQHALERLP